MRKLCVNCKYPANACICSSINIQDTRYKIHVLQHHKETKHAKNTARIAQLCIPSLSISIIKNDDDIDDFVSQIVDKRCAVFYLDKCSRVLENSVQSFANQDYDALIYIDGSWKQTKGIYARLVQRVLVDTWEMHNAAGNNYYIRKSPFPKGLSTLEAIAHTIEIVEKINVSTLHNALCAFQNTWQGPQSLAAKE